MEFKKPLTVAEQVNYLESNKRVTYNTISKEQAKEILYTHNYINVISPFKYNFARKNDNGYVIKDKNCNHIYDRNIEFVEYYERYKEERSQYIKLYAALSTFESSFNAIVSNKVICAYQLIDDCSFNTFISSIQSNIKSLSNESSISKSHMIDTINNFKDKLLKYNSIYIFMDRLTISELITIYKSCGTELSIKIFKELNDRGLSLGYTRKTDFDNVLSKIIQIRNCIMHNNSLTILIRYYSVKEKSLRKDTDRKSYQSLIRKLLELYANKYN